jgi:phage nucleotide-binding protein
MATTTAKSKHPFSDSVVVKSASVAIPWLNFMPYGDPGAGKTHLAGTAQDHPETSPVLLIDVEGGTVTLRHRPDIDVVIVRSMRDIEKIHKELIENPDYYKTVCIDSLTELQKLDMMEIMKDAVNKRPDQDPDTPAQRDWGKSQTRVRKIVRAFRDLECNTILTALAAQEKDGQTQAITYYPSFPGKLKTEIAGFLDIVGYLYTEREGESVTRKLQVVQSRRVTAKDRTNALGLYLENPTIPMMWELITNSK